MQQLPTKIITGALKPGGCATTDSLGTDPAPL